MLQVRKSTKNLDPFCFSFVFCSFVFRVFLGFLFVCLCVWEWGCVGVCVFVLVLVLFLVFFRCFKSQLYKNNFSK